MLALLVLLGALRLRRSQTAFSAQQNTRVIVVDAGHGGEDGGALSADGTVIESGINLAIALDARELLRFLGVPVVMTRTEDVSIYSPGATTLRQKKVSDLKNRVALVNGTEGALLVSIHQNSLPSMPRVQGAQVFFGAVEGSDRLAASVQAALNASVNGKTKKSERQIDSSIYLMKNVRCPAILVECGFLSNAAEAALLQTPQQQRLLAAAIVCGVLAASERQEGEGYERENNVFLHGMRE